MDIGQLIKEITPHYNKYRKNQQHLNGAQALDIIWEVGDLLKIYLFENEIAPRSLYDQIYGKSERNFNISQKSYITRDFLDRAFRVRRIFKEKKDINKTFPKLQRYRLFYKSMPFFDDGRYKMDVPEREKLITLLNSNKSYKTIISEIIKLQRTKIGLSMPRDGKLRELESEKSIFIKFYNSLYQQIKEKNYNKILQNIGNFESSFLRLLSRNTGALASDSFQLTKFQISDNLSEEWKEYAFVISKLISRKDAMERRRFRRLIPPEKMTRLSEMIYALTDKEKFQNFKP